MIRTLTFALRRDPDTSRAIGHHATQQNLAYNHAVDVLNREPNLPQRSGKNHPNALNKRITAWRQAPRQKADAPYYIHQEGGEQAWEANQRLQEARAARLERIANAAARGEAPKHRDIQHHHRTLAHRTRKQSRLSLTITDRRLLAISDDGQTLASRQCGFTVRLRGHQNLKWLDIRSIRLVPVKDYGARVPLHRRRYCLHAQVSVPKPTPIAELVIQRTSSAPTVAPRTTLRSAPGTAPTTRAVGDAVIKSASTSATSPASRVTASAASTPSPGCTNNPAATPSSATRTSGSRSATSC